MQTKRNFSAKRDAIYKMLTSTDTHPSAEWIYEQLKPQIPDLSLGTVYRNLSVFKESGLIRSVGVLNGQERFDWNTSIHSHFVCNRCFKIMDVPKNQFFTNKNITQNVHQYMKYVEEQCHVKIEGHQFVFYGICEECADKKTVAVPEDS